MARRIGIYGGTFDPIHLGHLIIGQEVLGQCQLDQVLFMPSGQPPHKTNALMAPAKDRAEMTRLALLGNDAFALCRFELDRPGKSYTIHTLRDLRLEMGDVDLFLIIGADNAADMRSWCDPEGVLDLAQVLVADRPGFDRTCVDPILVKKMQFVKTPLLEISSTDIRARVQKGLSLRYRVPDAVAEYIAMHGLYR